MPYGLGIQPPGPSGLDFQQALGSVPSQFSQESPLSFPGPDGNQPPLMSEQRQYNSAVGAVYFPSPIPPDEEPPYIPEKAQTEKEGEGDSEEAGHGAGNAGGSVGGNTGLAASSEAKPEGALVIDEKGKEQQTNEKEPEKQDTKA